MREQYHRELDNLDQDVVRLGALVESAIERATTAVIENDAELAEQVMDGDSQIDDLFVDIEKRVLEVLAKQAPVARDLRLMVAILRATNDLERSGDLAFNIAKVAKRQIPVIQVRPIAALLYELGLAAHKLLGDAIDSWAKKDPALAERVSEYDDTIDDLYRKFYRQLFACGADATSFEVGMNAALVGRWFERIADHGVNIAEHVQFYVTGEDEFLG